MQCPNVSDARVTCVPPHAATICHIKALTRKIDRSTDMLSSEIEDCANGVLDGVIKELEDRAIGAGTVTNAGLVDKLKEAINFTGIQRLVEHVESGATIGMNGNNEGDVYMDNISTLLINGAVSIVPEGFKLKRCGSFEFFKYSFSIRFIIQRKSRKRFLSVFPGICEGRINL